MSNKIEFSDFCKDVLNVEPTPHQKKLFEQITKQVNENAVVNLMPMPRAYLGKYSRSVTIDTLKKLKKDIESPKGSFTFHRSFGEPIKGLRGLKAEQIIIDEFHHLAEQEFEKEFFKNTMFGYKVIVDPFFNDYEKVRLSFKEIFFSFKWLTWYKKVYKPKIIQDKEGHIYCSPRTANELRKHL